MSLWTVLILAVGLGMDAFAVAVSAGVVLGRLSAGRVFRLAWHFGLFQFMMPVIGWMAGLTVQRWVASWDHWVAFLLLLAIGGKMLWESRELKSIEQRGDPTKGWLLIGLSVATSIDALAVGVSMAMLGIEVWRPAIIIGIVAAVMTMAGMVLGKRLGAVLGGRMEVVGGLVLIAIGVKILVEGLRG